MAKTIDSLLIGIGFDVDKKSSDKVSSGIDSIKSKALQLGSVVAGAFGIKKLTNDFAAAKDTLGKFATIYGSTAETINAFGNALGLEGGNLSSLLSQLASLEKFRAGLATGNIGFIAAAGKAKLDVSELIKAKNVTEAYLVVADQFQKMTRQQRINAASAIGLDEASIRLLSKGRAAIEAVVAIQRKIRPITPEMLKAAQVYNDEIQNLTENIGGLADRISEQLVPNINKLVKGMNDFISSNRGFINKGVDFTAKAMNTDTAQLSFLSSLFPAAVPMLMLKDAMGAASSGFKQVQSNAAASGVNPVDEFYNNIGAAISKAFSQGPPKTPIVIQNNINLDGQVIERKIQRVVGGMADQAIQDLRSIEGG